MRIVALSLLLAFGCAEGQQKLEDARSAVRDTGQELQRTREVIIALCREPAPEQCAELVDQFNKLQAAYTKVNEAMP